MLLNSGEASFKVTISNGVFWVICYHYKIKYLQSYKRLAQLIVIAVSALNPNGHVSLSSKGWLVDNRKLYTFTTRSIMQDKQNGENWIEPRDERNTLIFS